MRSPIVLADREDATGNRGADRVAVVAAQRQGLTALFVESAGTRDNTIDGDVAVDRIDIGGGGAGKSQPQRLRTGAVVGDGTGQGKRVAIKGKSAGAGVEGDVAEGGSGGEPVGGNQRRAAGKHQRVAADRSRAAPVGGVGPIVVAAATGPSADARPNRRNEKRRQQKEAE